MLNDVVGGEKFFAPTKLRRIVVMLADDSHERPSLTTTKLKPASGQSSVWNPGKGDRPVALTRHSRYFG